MRHSMKWEPGTCNMRLFAEQVAMVRGPITMESTGLLGNQDAPCKTFHGVAGKSFDTEIRGVSVRAIPVISRKGRQRLVHLSEPCREAKDLLTPGRWVSVPCQKHEGIWVAFFELDESPCYSSTPTRRRKSMSMISGVTPRRRRKTPLIGPGFPTLWD